MFPIRSGINVTCCPWAAPSTQPTAASSGELPLPPSLVLGAGSVPCWRWVGASVCRPPDGPTCLGTAGSGPPSRVWLSLAGTVQASQTLVAAVRVTRQSGTLASQLLHVSNPRTEPLLGAATPLPFAHLPIPGRAWSERDLGSFGTAIGSSLITFSLTC